MLQFLHYCLKPEYPMLLGEVERHCSRRYLRLKWSVQMRKDLLHKHDRQCCTTLANPINSCSYTSSFICMSTNFRLKKMPLLLQYPHLMHHIPIQILFQNSVIEEVELQRKPPIILQRILQPHHSTRKTSFAASLS